MSKNKWETQPRKENGEFTFRNNPEIKQYIINLLLDYYKRHPNDVSKTSKGGSYGELRKSTKGNHNLEIHHMPANSASPLSRWKGPCVILEKEDHALTKSFKNSKSAVRYRQVQKKLIEKGLFLEAELLDILDLLKQFGSKYSKAILEKIAYDQKLQSKGDIND